MPDNLKGVKTRLDRINDDVDYLKAQVEDLRHEVEQVDAPQGSWVQVKLDDDGAFAVKYAYNVPNQKDPLHLGDRVAVRLPGGHLTVRRVVASGVGKNPRATKNAALVITDSVLQHLAENAGV